MTAPQRNPDDVTKRIEADGAHSVSDIARRLLGDVRAAPLLLDMNPELRAVGAVQAGLLVTLPTKNQLRAFARRHGFTLGFDERAPNGTDARKKWAVLAGAIEKSAPVIEPQQLALSLLARGVSVAEVARRVHRQCPAADLGALVAGADARLAQVSALAEAHRTLPVATSRLTAARSLLETTTRYGGFRSLLEGIARDPEGARALLGALVVTAPLIDALVRAAPHAAALVRRARDLAIDERGARDIQTQKDPVLRALVAACVDGVEPIAADRIALVGLEAEHAALEAHLRKLCTALRQAVEGLSRAPLEVLRACAGCTDGLGLPKPWPLVARIVAALHARSVGVTMTSLDAGLAGLLSAPRAPAPRAQSGAAIIPLAILQARASTCARTDDEGEAFASRLAKTVVALFDALRPAAVVDGGAPSARRARRRAAFDLAVSARGTISPQGICALLDDALDAARACGIGRVERLKPQQLEAARRAAAGLVGGMSVARRPMSELGRALVVAAMVVEPELAHSLARPTGQEAFMQTAAKHAARVLSAAACQLS